VTTKPDLKGKVSAGHNASLHRNAITNNAVTRLGEADPARQNRSDIGRREALQSRQKSLNRVGASKHLQVPRLIDQGALLFLP
jgi:hypothetical protein